MRNAYVVVRGGRIEHVATSPVSVPDARAIELGTATLLPGIIDAHVHPAGISIATGSETHSTAATRRFKRRSRAREISTPR
jgi:imidazolonepropionase-like amidohydrolase